MKGEMRGQADSSFLNSRKSCEKSKEVVSFLLIWLCAILITNIWKEGSSMLNEDKIRLMNEIAIYAKREGRRENPAQKYFRGDYVAKHVLQSFFAYTLSAALFLGVFSLYRLEVILSMVNVMDVLEKLKHILIFYVLGLLLFEALTVIIYRRKYSEAKERRLKHLTRLNRLKKRYEIQNRQRELIKEGGRNA